MPEQQDSLKERHSREQPRQGQTLRVLSRSPHPYRRQRAELPHARLKPSVTFPTTLSPLRSTQNSADESSGNRHATCRGHEFATFSTGSDSGTEADDEHFLKGLPAPKRRPHKGLIGGEGVPSGASSPLVSPAILKVGLPRKGRYTHTASTRRRCAESSGKVSAETGS
jgi:hypothetical protein